MQLFMEEVKLVSFHASCVHSSHVLVLHYSAAVVLGETLFLAMYTGLVSP